MAAAERLGADGAGSAHAGAASGGVALAAVAAAALALYLLTPCRAHDWDPIAYAARIAGDPLLSERYLSTRLLHPHHLLYVSFGRAVCALLGALAHHDPFAPLQWANAALGAACVLLGGTLVRDLTGSPRRALAAAAALALGNGTWTYASEVEVMIPAIACVLLALLLVRRARSAADLALSGAAMALAILFHQLALLAAVATIAALLVAPTAAGRRGAALFAAACALPVLVAYLLAATLGAHARSLPAVLDWALAARSRSELGSTPLPALLRHALGGCARSVVALEPLARAGLAPALAATLRAVALLLAIGAALLALAALPTAWRWARRECVIGALLGSVALTALFVVGFEPGNLDYWVEVLAPAWLLLAACAPLPAAAARATRVAVPVALLLLGTVNLLFRALPDHDPANADYRAAVELARTLRPAGGVLYVGAADELGHGMIAVPFFAHVDVDEAAGTNDVRAAAALAAGRTVFATGPALEHLAGVRAERAAGALAGDTLFALRRR